MEKVKKIDVEKLNEILLQYDNESVYEKVNTVPHSSDLRKEISEYMDVENHGNRAVLGIDIYRYSSYEYFEQTLIPVIFKILFDRAVKMSIDNSRFIFQKYNSNKLQKSFLSTGDGGFLILDTPMHALVFAINFELAVRLYNSYHLYPKLRKIIGHLNLRYAITFDKIFEFNNNYFGTSIINNARILERDNLNRCLIDQASNEWFMINIDGIENLQVISINEVANIVDFQDYKLEGENKVGNVIFANNGSRESGIINSDILKIGQITSKQTDLNIYNLHLQVAMRVADSKDKNKNRIITISLGNLNTTGI